MRRKRSSIVIVASILMVVFYSVFALYPLLASIKGSFYDWNPLTGVNDFIGIDNYTRLFSDALFGQALFNTIYFATLVVVGRVVLGFLIALGLYSIVKWQKTLRAMYFLPVIMPMVSVALVWKWMYDPRIGLINMLLAMFGMGAKNWLTDANFAMNSVILMTIWKDIGYAIIIFMAGLLNIPISLLEAAKIDGATYWQTVRKIMIPVVKPTIIFVVITSIISYFQTFTQIYIMTKGGPGTSTTVLGYLIYQSAFKDFEFGYASAISAILFIIIIIVTFVQFKVMGDKNNEKQKN